MRDLFRLIGNEPVSLVADERASIIAEREYVRRHGLYGFIKLAWHLIEPSERFVDGWHLEEMAAHAQALTEGRINRLCVNVPPGSMKSITFSISWHPWTWIQDPGHKFIFMCYAPDLAELHASKAINILTSTWFTQRWPHVQLSSKVPAKGFIENKAGGWRFSGSVRGGVTGRHATTICVDDPIKPADTLGGALKTKVQLEYVINWWKGTMSTRTSDPSKTRKAVIMQRLAEGDLVGHIKSGADGEKYEHLCLPAEFVPERACKTKVGGDRRTEKDELLWPQRVDRETLERLKLDLGIHAAAQLQQNPSNPKGEVLKREFFRHWQQATIPPRFDRLIWSWDCAFKDKPTADRVYGTLWGMKGSNIYLLARIRDRLSFPDTVRAIIQGKISYSNFGVARETLIEDKANGSAVISTLADHVPGIVPIDPDGGKVARANSVSYLFKCGNVFFPDPSMPGYDWVHEYEDELVAFPNAKHDDAVDSTTQALMYLTQTGPDLWAVLAQRQGVSQIKGPHV